MFRHAQLESVKAWLLRPDQATLPRHARIQRALRALILDGALPVGTPLPATRALAQSLGVSRDTVENAYRQLHAEGFIERRVGSGSRVSQRARRRPPPPTVFAAPRLSQRGEALFRAGGVRDFASPRPFAPGVPETRLVPLRIWERLQRQVLRDYGSRALAHSPPQGLEPLRQAIADYVNLERGARASAEQVVVLTSSQQAMALCAQVLFDPGDGLFIEDPMYHGARRAFNAAGLALKPIPVDADGMQVELLLRTPEAARAVFLTPSHQFPTGATLSLERRLAVVDWARRHQGWIIEDDYDSEFHYAGQPTACVQGLDDGQRTLYIGTFTKSLFPGLRLGYLLLPPDLVAPMTVARTLQDGHSAPLAQLTLARFIEGGHFGTHVRAMRTIYAERLALLVSLLQQHLGGLLQPQVPAGGLQLPCLLAPELDEAEAVSAARRVGIDVLGLSTLSAGGHGRAGLLLGFAAYTAAEMDAGVKKLARALRRVRR